MSLLFYFYGFAFGVGTNLASNWYYPIRGIGFLDILLVIHFAFRLLGGSGGYGTKTIPIKTATVSCMVFALSFWLLLSAWINSFQYESDILNIFAILRFLYFIVLIVFVSEHVERSGYFFILIGYLAGVAVLFCQDFLTLTEENPVILGIPVLTNPNVVGAALGLAVYFCSLGVISGRERIFVPLAIVFSAASVTTFSKGTWIMIVLGLLANLLALNIYDRTLPLARQIKKRKWRSIYFISALGIVLTISYLFGSEILALVNIKLESTHSIGSFDTRLNLLLAGLYAAADNPLLGLGFGNFYQVAILYPSLSLPITADLNAHNAFAQVAATGGFPALLSLLAIFVFTFAQLFTVLRRRLAGRRSIKVLYFVVSLAVFVLFGSVQLQLLAQPTFWFFCALLIGVSRSNGRSSDRTVELGPPQETASS